MIDRSFIFGQRIRIGGGSRMKNAEVIASDLLTAIKGDNELLECVCDYIAYPSEKDCKYDGGKNHTPCTECKMKWFKKEFE